MESKLPKKTLGLWQLRIIVAGLILSVIIAYFGGFSSTALVIAVIFLSIFCITGIIYGTLLIKSYRIKVNVASVSVSYGVIIKSTHIMPYPRMVYVSTLSTPLAKIMGLSCVAFKAAGKRILVPELSNNTVLEIMSCISGEVPNNDEN